MTDAFSIPFNYQFYQLYLEPYFGFNKKKYYFPGAEKTAAATVPVNEFYCGSMMGLATAIAAANTDALSKTVCCKYQKTKM